MDGDPVQYDAIDMSGVQLDAVMELALAVSVVHLKDAKQRVVEFAKRILVVV